MCCLTLAFDRGAVRQQAAVDVSVVGSSNFDRRGFERDLESEVRCEGGPCVSRDGDVRGRSRRRAVRVRPVSKP